MQKCDKNVIKVDPRMNNKSVHWVGTKYPGVQFREHETRKFKRRLDRSIIIRYRKHGKLVNETVGWETDGATLEEAAKLRGQIIQNIRLGSGFQSLKEKRELEQTKRKKKIEEKKSKEIENISFEQLAQNYLDWARSHKKSWRDDYSRYQYHLGPSLGKLVAKKIKVLELERFKKKLNHKGLAPGTIRHCLVLIRQIYNRASRIGLFDGPNPIKETSQIDRHFLKTPDNRRLRFLSRDEADSLLTELKQRSPQVYNMTLLSLHTGMRAGEIFALTWQDIDLAHKIITIRNPKNNESRQAYMTPQVFEILGQLKNANSKRQHLIFSNRKGNQIKEISNVFSKIVQQLGLNDGVTDLRSKLVFHSIRHTFASWLALQGETLLTIKELMGHKDINMTMRYAHLIPDQKRNAVIKLGIGE